MRYLLHLVLLTPLVFTDKMFQSFSLVKAHYFEIVGGLLITISFFFVKRVRVPAMLLAMMILWTISTVLSEKPYVSFWGAYNRGIGLSGYMWLCLYAVLLVNFYTKRDFDRIFGLLPWLGSLYGLLSIAQYFGLSGFLEGWSISANKMISFAGNSNMAGNVVVLCLPFALYRKNYLSMILCISGCVLSFSRSASVAMLCIILFWYIKSWKARKFIFIIGLFVFIGGRFLPSNTKLGSIFHYEKTLRFRVIKESIPLISVFGTGIEQYRMAYGKIKTKECEEQSPGVLFDTPHNIYANWIATAGVFGGLLYISIVGLGLRHSNRAVRYAWLSYAIWGFGSFDTSSTNVIIWTMIASVFNEDYNNHSV